MSNGIGPHRKGIYTRCIKRVLDVLFSGLALIVLSPVLLAVAILVRIKLGSPVIFCQKRPGKNEKIFKMYKFRSMSNARDVNGNLLPDEARLTVFGRKLRSTSLDELPELWNIFKGDMSIVGPRPQLVRDMVFMTPEQRKRHTVLPGLTGWAQINGRNCMEWEDKLRYDLEYLERISFLFDMKIIICTAFKVMRKEDISYTGMATAEDYGDYLLRTGLVGEDQYRKKQGEAQDLMASAR